MNRWRWVALALVASALNLTVLHAHAAQGADWTYGPQDTLQAMDDLGASDTVRCIVYYEVGRGSRGYAPYDPNQIGAQGERGAAQLHPRGLLADFTAWATAGYGNGVEPENPWLAVAYLQHREALGRAYLRAWSAVGLGWC